MMADPMPRLRTIAPDAEPALKIGDKVRLNERGRQRFKKNLDRRGVVIAMSSTRTAYRVRWDDQAVAYSLHGSYLMRDDADV
jgi:hypothetical protein